MRHLIASPVTLEGMEREAAAPAPVLETVLRGGTLRQVQEQDPDRKTVRPVTLADMELKAVRVVHVQGTVL